MALNAKEEGQIAVWWAADKTGARLVNEFGLDKSDVERKLRGMRNEAWGAAKAARG